MKTQFTPRSAIEKSIILGTLISLVFWVYPEALVLAHSGEQSMEQKQALVFEIKNPISNTNSINIDQIVESDPLVLNLQTYLENLNSPLSVYAKDIVQQPQWQRALAISWVESNMGIHCYDNNCSGIGVEPGHPSWRKYSTKLDWFKDMTQLLEKPIYKEKFTTFKQMRGVYVQPGSANWVYGAQKKYDELTALTEKSEADRQLANSQAPMELALASFPSAVR